MIQRDRQETKEFTNVCAYYYYYYFCVFEYISIAMRTKRRRAEIMVIIMVGHIPAVLLWNDMAGIMTGDLLLLLAWG